MRVGEMMKTGIDLISPDETAQSAARALAELNEEALLVGSLGRVEGIVTLRDFVIRVVAEGLDPAATPLRSIMSTDVVVCTADATIEDAQRQMTRGHIGQMPVVDDERRVIGMIEAARIAEAADNSEGKTRVAGAAAAATGPRPATRGAPH